jgi:hypothetical protein
MRFLVASQKTVVSATRGVIIAAVIHPPMETRGGHEIPICVAPDQRSNAWRQVTVRARLTGEFPGSPIELDHIFTLSNGKIASLEIRS